MITIAVAWINVLKLIDGKICFNQAEGINIFTNILQYQPNKGNCLQKYNMKF